MANDFPFEKFLKNPKKSNLFKNFDLNVDETTSDKEAHFNKSSKINSISSTFSTKDKTAQSDMNEDKEEIQALKQEIFKLLKQNITAGKYSTYFENTFDLAEIENDKVIFVATTAFIKTIIQGHYQELLKNILKNLLGKEYDIVIKVSENLESLSSNDQNILKSLQEEKKTDNDNFRKNKTSRDFRFKLDIEPTKDDQISNANGLYLDHVNPKEADIVIDESKKFNNFVIGPSNQLAYATACAIADKPGKSGKYPSIYIYSDSGLGKTHLLHAVANGINDKYPQMRVCLITARDFMKEMIEHIKNQEIEIFQKKYSEKIDVLMIDDIHELKDKKGTQDEFFHIFNELHNKGKQLIFTSDQAPKEIDGIVERVKTRLQWGLVVDIQRPDLETRIAILRKKAYELDLFVQDDVINLIASCIKNSIRELEGSLIKLQAFSEVMQADIDMELAKELLGIDEDINQKKITIDQIAKSTANYYKIPLADLKSKARSKEITQARHMAMYLARKLLSATQKEIGRFFGGRDHTSVIHGVNTMRERIKRDPHFSKDALFIENNLQ